MSDRDAFRAEQQTRRQFGKAKQHEKRLENATYTAAEVKVLTETASKVAYELGRKDAGEEIAAALMRENNLLESLPKDEPAVNQQARSAVIFRGSAFRDGAKIARDITAQPQNAASDATSVPSEGPGTSEPSKAAKTPQEPCEYCGLIDDHKGGCPQTGEAPRPGAPG